MMMEIKLTKEHFQEVMAVQNGADVFGYRNAKLLREVEKVKPEWINIVPAQGEYNPVGKLPYFGCIATSKGLTDCGEVLTSTAENDDA
jgi:hypothetical protein